MNQKEIKAVEAIISQIYGNWHACGLSKENAKAMKLKPGRLCDDCNDMIKAHMQDLKEMV